MRAFIALMLVLGCPSEADEIILHTYFQDSAPKSFINKNSVSGLSVDIMLALNERLVEHGIRINPLSNQFVPWPRILADLKSGTIQLFIGISKDSKREKLYTFAAHPLYELHDVFVKRKGKTFEYSTSESLVSMRVVALRGSESAGYLSDSERVRPQLVGTIDQALNMLLLERVELVLYHDLAVLYALKQKGLAEQLEVSASPYRSKAHYIGFNKQVAEKTIERVNSELLEIVQQGTIETLIKQYR